MMFICLFLDTKMQKRILLDKDSCYTLGVAMVMLPVIIAVVMFIIFSISLSVDKPRPIILDNTPTINVTEYCLSPGNNTFVTFLVPPGELKVVNIWVKDVNDSAKYVLINGTDIFLHFVTHAIYNETTSFTLKNVYDTRDAHVLTKEQWVTDWEYDRKFVLKTLRFNLAVVLPFVLALISCPLGCFIIKRRTDNHRREHKLY